MKRFKDNYITVVLILIVIAVNIGAFGAYVNNVKYSLALQTETHIDNILNEAVECINLKLDEQMNTMETMSSFITTLSSHDNVNDILEELLKRQKESYGYSLFELVPAGNGETEANKAYSDKEYYKNALKGKTVIVEEINEGNVTDIVLASPVYTDGGEINGVLVAKMDSNTFYRTIEIPSLEQNGKCFVVKKDGTLISKSENLMAVSKINDLLPKKEYADSLINGMRSRTAGIISCQSDGQNRYIGYEKLSINKWYVVSIISSDAVEASVSDMETDMVILGVELGFILLVLIVYFIYTIISRKNREKMNLERYFIAAKYADTIMVDYSIAKDTMYCNEKWEKLFGYTLPRSNIKEKLTEHFYSEDREIFINNYKELIDNNIEKDFSARVLDKEGNPVKCSFKLFPICEKKGKIVKIIGFIETED